MDRELYRLAKSLKRILLLRGAERGEIKHSVPLLFTFLSREEQDFKNVCVFTREFGRTTKESRSLTFSFFFLNFQILNFKRFSQIRGSQSLRNFAHI